MTKAKDTTPELDGMPDRDILVTYKFRPQDTTAYLATLPDVGDPKKFPSLSVGRITQIVEKEDKDGAPIAVVTVAQVPR